MTPHTVEIHELAAKASVDGDYDLAAVLTFLGEIHAKDDPALMREVFEYLKGKVLPPDAEEWPDTFGPAHALPV